MEKIIARCKACSHSAILRTPEILNRITPKTKFRCGKCRKAEVEILVARAWNAQYSPAQPQLSAEVARLQHEAAQLARWTEALRSEQESFLEKNQQLERQKKELEASIATLSVQQVQQKEKETKELRLLQSQKHHLEESQVEMTDQVNRLRLQLKGFEQQYIALQDKKEQLEAELAQLSGQKSEIMAQIRQANQELEEVEANGCSAQEELESELIFLRQQKTDLETKLSQLNRQFEEDNWTKVKAMPRLAQTPGHSNELDRLLGGMN